MIDRDYDNTFSNESNFDIEYSIKGWYAIKQINHTKPMKIVSINADHTPLSSSC